MYRVVVLINIRKAIFISFHQGPKIMYFYLFYASIQLYTHCISEMTVAMFVLNYHHFRCYILHNVLKFICTFLWSIRRIFRKVRSSENKM